jgi:hypothetical protein
LQAGRRGKLREDLIAEFYRVNTPTRTNGIEGALNRTWRYLGFSIIL